MYFSVNQVPASGYYSWFFTAPLKLSISQTLQILNSECFEFYAAKSPSSNRIPQSCFLTSDYEHTSQDCPIIHKPHKKISLSWADAFSERASYFLNSVSSDILAQRFKALKMLSSSSQTSAGFLGLPSGCYLPLTPPSSQAESRVY